MNLKNFLLTILLIYLSSCAVHLASTGEDTPDMTNFQKGHTRFDVESNLGAPLEFKELPDGNKQAVYEFMTGTAPSKTRATMWLVSDLFLAFTPELIGTPYELLKGKKNKIKVIYNPNYVIKEIKKIN